MPELPEVETIRRDLEKLLAHRKIAQIAVHDLRLMKEPEQRRWKSNIVGRDLKQFLRRGKYLIVGLEQDWQIIFHLRMTGQLVVNHPKNGSKSRMILTFDNGDTLSFIDQRRFGEVWLLSPGQAWPSKSPLGPDAMTELKRDDFIHLVKRRTTRIQPLLMDQRLISGVGNIYAQEALFKAQIRPSRSGMKITRNEAARLFDALRETLGNAIEYRGSTSRNYRDALGQSGTAQQLHAVYRKGGQPCLRCGGTLTGIRVGGRGSVYCPRCQR